MVYLLSLHHTLSVTQPIPPAVITPLVFRLWKIHATKNVFSRYQCDQRVLPARFFAPFQYSATFELGSAKHLSRIGQYSLLKHLDSLRAALVLRQSN